MKYTFVGDIHGKVEAVEKALDREGHVVFVGDIMDSFDRTITEHERCFELIIEAIKSGKATCLYGNHDLHYIVPSMKGSGWSLAGESLMRDYYHLVKEHFKYYLYFKSDNPILVTHAGLTNQLWKEHDISLDNLEETLEIWCESTTSPAYQIGHVRGGRDLCGGIFWCDFNGEFQPVDGLTQIFGHTAVPSLKDDTGIRIEQSAKGDNYCIDCLDRKMEFLSLDIEVNE